MSDEIKASISDFKHKFYDRRVDVPFEMPDGITVDDLEGAIDDIAKRSDEYLAKLLERCECGKTDVLPPDMTEEEFLAWVRNHE